MEKQNGMNENRLINTKKLILTSTLNEKQLKLCQFHNFNLTLIHFFSNTFAHAI